MLLARFTGSVESRCEVVSSNLPQLLTNLRQDVVKSYAVEIEAAEFMFQGSHVGRDVVAKVAAGGLASRSFPVHGFDYSIIIGLVFNVDNSTKLNDAERYCHENISLFTRFTTRCFTPGCTFPFTRLLHDITQANTREARDQPADSN